MKEIILMGLMITGSAMAQDQAITADLQNLLRPIWKGEQIENETLLPTAYNGRPAKANLAIVPSEIIRVQNYALDTTYEEGKDYTFKGRTLRLTDTSSIPFLNYEELYHNNPDAKPGVMATLDGGYLTFGESDFFNDRQLAITYKHSKPWKGPVPQSAKKQLPKTFHTLEAGRPLKLTVFGDSISVGANSSGFDGRAPWLPRWADLVAGELERNYGSKIDYKNPSIGGMESGWGKDNAAELVAADKPDLVIIGFGMNDTGAFSPNQFRDNIESMIESVREENPAAEFILLMSFQPNEKWMNQERMIGYLKKLHQLEEPGIVVADVWSIHGYLLSEKTYWDMTGNHVNHPNDFIVRVYAQVLLARLGIE